ncbi:hypothetical protein CPBF367_38930 [Xanthomonas arboricola pv. juglandis]|nr:hypothetical protein CPBF367_38930 [Xanthomonas arboricola pv. juglandis]
MWAMEIAVVVRADARLFALQANPGHAGVREAREQRVRRDQSGRGRICQHVRDPLARIRRVDGNVDGTRLQDRQQAHDQVDAARQADGDAIARLDAHAQQMACHLIGALVDSGVGHDRVALDHGGAVRLRRG